MENKKGEKRKKEERKRGRKNCSHELNAARKKYHSRQPYYPSNGEAGDPRTGEEKNGEKAGQRGNVIRQIKI